MAFEQYKYFTDFYEDISNFSYFVTNLVGAYKSMFYITNADATISQLVSYAIYNYFKNYRTAFEDKTSFDDRISYDILKIYPKVHSKLKKYLHDLSASNLNDKGHTNISRSDKSQQQRSAFTKQANTPTTIDSTEQFVNDYTDYQSNTSTKFASEDEGSTGISKLASYDELIDVYNKIGDDFFSPIVEAVKQNFIYMEGDFN